MASDAAAEAAKVPAPRCRFFSRHPPLGQLQRRPTSHTHPHSGCCDGKSLEACLSTGGRRARQAEAQSSMMERAAAFRRSFGERCANADPLGWLIPRTD
eukprot:COSAG01_NODE_1888_length_8979_cov_78.343806_5_plen_99_part_00